jgi:hypothetical protein
MGHLHKGEKTGAPQGALREMPGEHGRAAIAAWKEDNYGRLDIDLTLCALFAAYMVCLRKYFCRL